MFFVFYENVFIVIRSASDNCVFNVNACRDLSLIVIVVLIFFRSDVP